MIYLLAFVAGLRDSGGIEILRTCGLDAAVVHGEPDALEHGLAVERLCADAEAVLPVRYGECFDDGGALDDAVRPQAEALRARLDELRGCVEISVRVVAREDPPRAPAADGRAYLASRHREYARRRQLEGDLDELLRGRARDSRRANASSGTVVFDAAYLVDRAEFDQFAGEVERAAARWPEFATLCTGPWAPYSFAEAAP
jgi:hypothetical protein